MEEWSDEKSELVVRVTNTPVLRHSKKPAT